MCWNKVKLKKKRKKKSDRHRQVIVQKRKTKRTGEKFCGTFGWFKIQSDTIRTFK